MSIQGSQSALNVRRVRLTANRRYLGWDSGAPFFYLADTAWELLHRLTREDTDLYLRNRAAKGVVKAQVKKFVATLEGGDAEAKTRELRSAIRALDKAAAHGVLHRNAAARRKARLTAKLKRAGAPAGAAPAPQA